MHRSFRLLSITSPARAIRPTLVKQLFQLFNKINLPVYIIVHLAPVTHERLWVGPLGERVIDDQVDPFFAQVQSARANVCRHHDKRNALVKQLELHFPAFLCLQWTDAPNNAAFVSVVVELGL